MTERDDIEIEIDDRERASSGRDGSVDHEAVNSDREGNDGDPTRATDALADELGRIDVMTTPEGYVEGRITDLAEIDEHTVRLDVALPHGRPVTFELDKPIPWSRAFLLCRIVEDVGYDAASIDHVVGEPVYVERADLDDTSEFTWWSASAGDVGRSLFARMGSRLDLSVRPTPEWELVDPRVRVDEFDGRTDVVPIRPAAYAAVVVGCLLAIAGALVGATGGLAISAGVLAYVLPGLGLLLAGLALLARRG
ncbi:hypothetical protein [Halovivax gelatinilyticus]|uniref:hypothetical protein n=1 Tax=Halovivax gelatinilyticus TaxID=2961597 RepID=UPI0020CA35F4|nr:hypothetical protein [Halovivax gelatinilyticus]